MNNQLTINDATDFLLTCLKHCPDAMQNSYRRACLTHWTSLYSDDYVNAIRNNLMTKLKIVVKKRKTTEMIMLP